MNSKEWKVKWEVIAIMLVIILIFVIGMQLL